MNKDFLSNFFNLRGKTILVTGATGQLGRQICEMYNNVGSQVIGVDKDLNSKRMIKSDNIKYFSVDVSDKKSVTDIFEMIYSKFSQVDVLINNAGISVFEPFEERSEESFDTVMDTNLKGTFFCIQSYVAGINNSKVKKGNIINIASVYGVVSPDFRIYTDCLRKNSEVYGATKAGIIQMTKYFAVHLAKDNVRVNCISPGGIFNPDNPQGEDFIKNYSERNPMGRMALVDEIIGGLFYLSSDAATYTTGQNIIIDGGMSCW
ncbi:MAG: SDR family oxidoreductase [Parcubacteria group bacterium]|nr:SDR family oxidoreductase [Parcubacteria group bacterium]